MSLLTQMPLRQKLTWLAMTCSVVALLSTAVALGAYEWVFYRKTMFAHLQTLAEVAARNSAAAVAFANIDDAERVLATLESESAVKSAALYDERGRRFAQYRRLPAPNELSEPSFAPEDGLTVVGAELQIVVPVMEMKRFGSLLVVADISAIQVRVAAYGIVLLCTTVVSGFLAYLLTGWLKGRIVAPVHALVAAAVKVQTTADYHVRVKKQADDEVGALTDAFNAMLERIERNEAEIASGSERLRLAVESAQIGTLDWNVPRDTMVWNERAYDIFGLDRGAHVAASLFFGAIHPEDRARVKASIETAAKNSTSFASDFRIWQGGRAQHVRYVAVRGRFFEGGGAPERAVGVILDVTDRRMAELRVIESEVRFRAVAERAPAMIWSCDQALHRDYFNKTWLAFTGRPVERELGDGWQESVPAADLRRWQEIVGSAAGQRDPYSVEYRLRRSDGALRWVIETGSPRLAADGSFAGYLGSCIDITTRKENEEELEQHVRLRTRELQAANQELESFSYSVSHDLRGPVRAIQGFAEIALEEIDGGNPTSARERIERVLRASDRMNKLIDAFIGMARVSRAELKIEPVNVSRIAEEVAAFLRSTDASRTVTFIIAPGLGASADERLLRIALENLMSNAWKFTSQRAQAEIEFGARKERGEMAFFVRDNGAGFDAALTHKLFHAFERLHPGAQFEGLGVGLSTVHRVIEKHGGRVWADSVLGEGATFFFTLPAPAAGLSSPRYG